MSPYTQKVHFYTLETLDRFTYNLGMKFKFTKSIRFQLTLWYSALLIAICAIFLIIVNAVVTKFYTSDPARADIIIPSNPVLQDKWRQLNEIQRNLVNEVRAEDLRKVRLISTLSFVPLVFFSFFGGYLISCRMLNPIQKINKAAKQISAKNLNLTIRHHDVGDEISELINNFNSMILRLSESFALQRGFIENASHELKTPLAIIQTNLEAALMEEDSLEEIRENLQSSLESTEFMNVLIEDLLILSLLQRDIEFDNTNIQELVEQSIKNLQILTKEKGINIKFKNDLDSTVYIQASETLLQRAIMNILENAIKYSHKNGKVEVTLKASEYAIQISMKDWGIGIPKEKQRNIFDRFYRVDKSRSRQTGGTGLGLSISKKIIQMHKGWIKVNSIEEVGSEFIIEIPL